MSRKNGDFIRCKSRKRTEKYSLGLLQQEKNMIYLEGKYESHNWAIKQGILVDILKEQKAEVLELVLTTFNRELYEQGLKEDAAKEAAKEANETIEKLKQELAEERRKNAELNAKVAALTQK